jgi:IS1 family transposase
MNVLPFKKQLQIVNALVEGNSIRATSRIVGVEHKTVMRVLLRVSDACGRLLNERVRHLHAKRIQVDEIWTYLLLKEKHKTAEHPRETGDQYVFVAMDSDTKLVISHLVGKRDYPNAFNLMADLKTRLANRVQLTTDGFRPFLMAVEDNFGSDIDYGVLVKMYGGRQGRERGASVVRASKGGLGDAHPRYGRSRLEAHLNQSHRAPEPHHEDADAKVYEIDQRGLQEARQPQGPGCASLRTLQLLPGALHPARHARYGIGLGVVGLDAGRFAHSEPARMGRLTRLRRARFEAKILARQLPYHFKGTLAFPMKSPSSSHRVFDSKILSFEDENDFFWR